MIFEPGDLLIAMFTVEFFNGKYIGKYITVKRNSLCLFIVMICDAFYNKTYHTTPYEFYILYDGMLLKQYLTYNQICENFRKHESIQARRSH